MRTFIIGDVHGCFDELRQLLKYSKSDDRVVFLGDLMDRGPNPIDVVRLVRLAGYTCIKGNHEEKHVRYRRYTNLNKQSGFKIPMRMSAESIKQNEMLSDYQIKWMADLPTTLELGNNWIAVHGGFEPFIPIEKQSPDKCMRIRYVKVNGAMQGLLSDSFDQPVGTVPWTDLWFGPRCVVYGHQVFKDIKVQKLPGDVVCVGLDTGCCYGGKLSAMILEEDGKYSFISVDAAKMYYDFNNPLKR